MLLPPPSELVGPFGALLLAVAVIVALVRIVVVLWRTHLEADADDRAQRDHAQSLADKAIEGLGELADAWRERDEHDANRRRRGDG